MPALHELTNGHYKVALSDSGTGQSFFDWIALNRWPGDLIEDSHGFFIYLRDVDTDDRWSAGLQPTLTQPDSYAVSREDKRFIIKRSDHEIESTMTVSVLATDNIETRGLRLLNDSNCTRQIEVTSYIEVALAHPIGDLGHPAFSKLFVQTEFKPECGALVAKRRPRSQGESWPAMFHAMSGAPLEAWETDRAVFIGRGRTAQNPASLMNRTVGNVLDPIMSLRTTLTLEAGESIELNFLLGAVEDHAQIEAVVRRTCGQERGRDVSPDQTTARPGLKSPPRSAAGLRFFNGHGGFSEDGKEYVIKIPSTKEGRHLPPMPWCNVIANESFGFITSETGAGCTWSRNSQANRLTPWSNDPICDPHGEALYLRDEDNGSFWSPLPGPCPAEAEYEMAHGFGYSRCTVTAHELEQETTMFVPRHDPVKLVQLKLTNRSSRTRRLSLFSYHRVVLGTLPPAAGALNLWSDGNGTLFAKNTLPSDFSGGTVFCYGTSSGGKVVATNFTLDRAEFIGANGSVRSPNALREKQLNNAEFQAGSEGCFAWQWIVELQAGETMELFIVLGEATDDAQLAKLTNYYREPIAMDLALSEVLSFWDHLLHRVKVSTPSPEIDLMTNGWLAYQAIACRMWGRTAFYQSSGAYGFRDQLQDAGNLTLLWPELTRSQLLLHARHQFTEGDVLHWWHDEPVERGVRTSFSDDLLWLPYVTSHYVRSTGDAKIWDEVVPFLKAPLLKEGEDENYLKPEASSEQASVFEHCCRAIDRSLTCGSHGLPLMGTGDWNDGMNRVGRGGQGESVWLGFFLYEILGDIIPLTQQRDEARAKRYATYRESLLLALNDTGWDGEWYRRAYYDDGTPLGTKSATECRIDGLAQSWSVLSGAAPHDRAQQAMKEAEQQLIDEEAGLIRLLTPPFKDTPEDPGYIKGYVAGVRENGGQYTHAACWMVQAAAAMGQRDQAARLLTMLSPLAHTRTPEDVQRYKVEPYVIAADVYGAVPHVGRGGWTWYTGSAGWAYRVAIESVLGLRVEGGDTLVIKPCVPDEWPSYRIDYRPPGRASRYLIEVTNPNRCSASIVSVKLDGRALSIVGGEARVAISGDATEHQIEIVLGSSITA